MEAHGYDSDSWIGCQICNSTSTDIHHIIYRSQGGKDEPKNLIALCRDCHNKAHFKEEPYLQVEELQEVVNLHLKTNQ